MDDSDEYFDDSLVLDEAALASIQATEDRYVASMSQHAVPPPSKRLKPSHEPSARIERARVSQQSENLELSPDIRVGPDGCYIIDTQCKATSAATRNSSTGGSTPRLQSGSADIQAEIASIRAQLAEMSAANAVIQQQLQEAQDAHLVKTGEVSILRQTIDKTKREHAEAIAKLKADMISNEKAKADLQAKLRDETERMATLLVFKQHELETSTRKPMWSSVRSRNQSIAASAVVVTPTRPQNQWRLPPFSHTSRQAPQSKGRVKADGQGPPSSPIAGRAPQRTHGEEIKQPQFKGFHNAFMDSEPAMTQSQRSVREDPYGNQDSDPFCAPIGEDEANDAPELKDSGMEGDLEGVGEDSRMEDEDLIAWEKFDWEEELRRVVFTHIAPRNDALTLHILLSTVIPTEENHAYVMACQVILETCGTRHKNTRSHDQTEWQIGVIDKVVSAFVTIVGVLSRTGCIAPLTSLLDLLMLLILCIPAFLPSFLGANGEVLHHQLDSYRPPGLLPVLCDVIRAHLSPSKLDATRVPGDIDKKEKARATLAMAVVQLMECLCWNVKDQVVEQLGSISSQPEVLEILLDPGQTPELITHTLQFLILLATHKNVFRLHPALSGTNMVEKGCGSLPEDNPSCLSLVEKLSHHLVEPAAEESYRIQHLVITLITLLSDLHGDARTTLLESVSLIPSLVKCITNLCRLLWEDDPSVLNDQKLAKTVVDTLYLSVNLLHYLVFVHELAPVLGRKLVEVSRLPGSFNGVTHMFIVTFGRLSWADVPDWLDEESKDKCDVIAELAVEIIGTIFAGPECDSLWTVWHQSEEQGDEEDEVEKIQTE